MKRFFPVMLSLLLVLSLFSAGYAEEAPETWAVYIFLCGSNLESAYGEATYNLNELIGSCYALPENVTFVVEAGGTEEWEFPALREDRQNRLIIDSRGFRMVEQLAPADMTEPETLKSFLNFAKTRYPADRTMLIMWDHGGGTCSGINTDENFPDSSMMSITSLHDALTESLGADEQDPPLDILVFDACLMATEDIADLFSDCASYMVASEETIPGKGTSYEGLCLSFIEDPYITPEQLGREILNHYMEKYEDSSERNGITLSLLDLSKAGAVASALDRFGGDLLKAVYEDPQVYLDISIAANDTVNYAVNSRFADYCNLVDLGSFAEKLAEDYPSAEELVAAIDDCVLDNVNGIYKADSRGISFYYSYNANEPELEIFESEGTSQALKALYSISVSGGVFEQDKAFVASLGLNPEDPPEVNTFDELDMDSPEVTESIELTELTESTELTDVTETTELPETTDVTEAWKRVYAADFGMDVGRYVTNAFYQLYYVSAATGAYYYIGTEDYGLETDFINGKFMLDPEGLAWIQIGEWLAVKDLAYDSEANNIYYIPVFSDGEICYLEIAKDNSTGILTFIGACCEGENPGEASALSIVQSEPDTDELFSVETVEYSDDLLQTCDLPDGTYAFRFVLEDIHKDTICSEFAVFYVENGIIL